MKTKRPGWVNTFYCINTRCNNPSHFNYKNYGKKGIKTFLTKSDVKTLWDRDNASEMKMPTIDRIDPSGNYEISNCRFIERGENTRRAKPWLHNIKNTKCKKCGGERYIKTKYLLCYECYKIFKREKYKKYVESPKNREKKRFWNRTARIKYRERYAKPI